ncbi:MAG: FtsQ-type POTRA domain-containing protein [Coleofasciculaceae cyanobacterium SM2_1_6]|nr:FtsQ-type POTRA domain-containing protein [Coleofasciculaceae cyanobacterium SM2_1_6]
MQRISPISRVAVTQRTKQLRRQRWWRGVQVMWRSLWVFVLAGTLIWLLLQPQWVINRPEQVIIRGNQLFSATAIQSILPLKYPQSLMKIQPEEIASQLEAKGPIASAIVTRNLLPPSLIIQITERKPVAISIPNPDTPPLSNPPSPRSAPTLTTTEGLIDETGVWMPRASYTALGLPLPQLRVIGLDETVRPQWQEIYQIINSRQVRVTEIDFRNPSNLILTTSLGKVHIGRYGQNFAKQLGILATLPQADPPLDPSKIAYINLRNVDRPHIVNSK